MMEQDENEQMTRMLRSHTERALQEIWDKRELVTDADGDYPFRSETAMCWVSIVDWSHPAVRVFALAANDVPKSAKMLAELTELNLRSRWVSISWDRGAIVVDTSVHWLSVDQGAVQRALDSVTTVADEIGVMIAAVFGGTTPFSPDLEQVGTDEDAA